MMTYLLLQAFVTDTTISPREQDFVAVTHYHIIITGGVDLSEHDFAACALMLTKSFLL